jgi:hypothetical protein
MSINNFVSRVKESLVIVRMLSLDFPEEYFDALEEHGFVFCGDINMDSFPLKLYRTFVPVYAMRISVKDYEKQYDFFTELICSEINAKILMEITNKNVY